MMTRRILALVCALMLLLLPAALAEGAGDYNLVLDEAGLLSVDASAALDAKAWQVSLDNDIEVVVLTENGLGGKSIRDYSADFWDEHGYGTGAQHSGVMLTLDMAERDWYILTTGEGIRYFTDYGIRTIGEEIVPYLSKGNYYGAFDRFLDLANRFAAEARQGQAFDTNHVFEGEPETLAQKLGKALPVGLIASVLATLFGMGGMKSGMHTAKKKHGAAQYARKDSMKLNRTMDVFLYHTQTRERLPERSSGGGGGSSTFTSSSGTTHGGGGGKF